MVMLPRGEAEDVLFHEAWLLDERRYADWLAMFTADGIYWLPVEEGSDPRARVSLIYDTSLRREERVFRLLNTPAHAQDPPSRTQHFVTNVRVEDGSNGAAIVHSSQLIGELRRGQGDYRHLGIGDQAMFAGRCTHTLRRESSQWRIAEKKLVLLNRDIAIANLTFIL